MLVILTFEQSRGHRRLADLQVKLVCDTLCRITHRAVGCNSTLYSRRVRAVSEDDIFIYTHPSFTDQKCQSHVISIGLPEISQERDSVIKLYCPWNSGCQHCPFSAKNRQWHHFLFWQTVTCEKLFSTSDTMFDWWANFRPPHLCWNWECVFPVKLSIESVYSQVENSCGLPEPVLTPGSCRRKGFCPEW